MIAYDAFEQRLTEDPELVALVEEVAQAVPPGEPNRFVGAETAGLTLATLALYRLVQNLADWHRGHLETDIVERRAALIQKLTEEDGVPFAMASKTVQALAEQVRKGRLTDTLFEKLLALFGKL